MLVTLDGISMLVKPTHPSKAYAPMLVTRDGISMLVNPIHFSNA